MLCASESASVLLMNVSREREREKEIVREGSVRYGFKEKTDSERLQRHVTDRSGTTEQEMKETRKERREGYEKVTGDRQEDTKKETGIGI